MGGCKEMYFFESRFIATCAGMMYLFCRKIKDDDDEDEMPSKG